MRVNDELIATVLEDAGVKNGGNPVATFDLGSSYLETDRELYFDRILIIVDRDWLLNEIKTNCLPDAESETAEQFLEEEYTWDDSVLWYKKALEEGKILTIIFD